GQEVEDDVALLQVIPLEGDLAAAADALGLRGGNLESDVVGDVGDGGVAQVRELTRDAGVDGHGCPLARGQAHQQDGSEYTKPLHRLTMWRGIRRIREYR